MRNHYDVGQCASHDKLEAQALSLAFLIAAKASTSDAPPETPGRAVERTLMFPLCHSENSSSVSLNTYVEIAAVPFRIPQGMLIHDGGTAQAPKGFNRAHRCPGCQMSRVNVICLLLKQLAGILRGFCKDQQC